MGDSLLASLRCKSRCGQALCGAARSGVVSFGLIWRVGVTADDLSTEGFGPLCWVLRNPDSAERASAGFALARCGSARHGSVRRGNRCRRQHWGLRLPLLLSLESRYGGIRYGMAGRICVWQCLVRSGYNDSARKASAFPLGFKT